MGTSRRRNPPEDAFGQLLVDSAEGRVEASDRPVELSGQLLAVEAVSIPLFQKLPGGFAESGEADFEGVAHRRARGRVHLSPVGLHQVGHLVAEREVAVTEFSQGVHRQLSSGGAEPGGEVGEVGDLVGLLQDEHAQVLEEVFGQVASADDGPEERHELEPFAENGAEEEFFLGGRGHL
jgi:hypothetical protein